MMQYFNMHVSGVEETEFVISVPGSGTLSLRIDPTRPQPVVEFSNITEPNHYRRPIVPAFFLERVDNT